MFHDKAHMVLFPLKKHLFSSENSLFKRLKKETLDTYQGQKDNKSTKFTRLLPNFWVKKTVVKLPGITQGALGMKFL